MPKPISSTVGASRPKAAARSRRRLSYGIDHLPSSCSSASRWPWVMWPRRWTKLRIWAAPRSEEHTSELQSLMRISYAVFCLKKKKDNHENIVSSMQNNYRSNQKHTHDNSHQILHKPQNN